MSIAPCAPAFEVIKKFIGFVKDSKDVVIDLSDQDILSFLDNITSLSQKIIQICTDPSIQKPKKKVDTIKDSLHKTEKVAKREAEKLAQKELKKTEKEKKKADKLAIKEAEKLEKKNQKMLNKELKKNQKLAAKNNISHDNNHSLDQEDQEEKEEEEEEILNPVLSLDEEDISQLTDHLLKLSDHDDDSISQPTNHDNISISQHADHDDDSISPHTHQQKSSELSHKNEKNILIIDDDNSSLHTLILPDKHEDVSNLEFQEKEDNKTTSTPICTDTDKIESNTHEAKAARKAARAAKKAEKAEKAAAKAEKAIKKAAKAAKTAKLN